MSGYHHHRGHRLSGAVLAMVLLGAIASHAAPVNLILTITTPLLDGDGNALADGSVFYVIGNQSGNVNPMQSFGDSFIADSTTGDDVIIAELILDSSTTGTPGTMFVSIPNAFDSDDIDFLYLRFFDFQDPPPVAGTNIPWGTTSPTNYTVAFGLAFYDTEGAQVSATNNFIVIPEPGTLHLFVVAGLLFALFFARREPKQKIA